MFRILRTIALFFAVFLSFDGTLFAAGFTCDAAKTYVSCDAGYYLSDCGSYRDARTISNPTAGNSCRACPTATSSAYYECVGGAVCPRNAVQNEFTLKINVPASGTVFAFDMSAAGVFYVKWGDGSVVQKIDRTDDLTNTRYPHTYTSTGTKTITISGQATNYNDTNYSMPAISFYSGSTDAAKQANAAMITAVSGSLGSVFGTLFSINPRFNNSFAYATNLKTVPSTLFSGITGFSRGAMFNGTFQYSGLTSIPSNLFAGISGDIRPYTFSATFRGCTGLTSIPENLFGDITGTIQDYAFTNMFDGCTNLSGPSAKINGKFVYDVWPSATTTQVGGMYTGATGLADWPCIPTNYGGSSNGCIYITYNANGGSGAAPTSPTYCVIGGTCNAPDNTFTYTGYDFLNWTAKVDGSSVKESIVPGADILSGYSESEIKSWNGVELTANWSVGCNKITLNNTTNGGSGGTTTIYKKTGSTTYYSDSSCRTAITSVTVPSKANASYLGHYLTSTNSANTGTQCISSTGVLSTSTSCNVSADTTWYAHYQCADGYTSGGVYASGACVAAAIITLDNNFATSNGTSALYGRLGAARVYLDSAMTQTMTPETYPITIPRNAPILTFDANGGTVEPTKVSLDPLVFMGYYSAPSGGTQYIDANGYITTDGMTALVSVRENPTWYAQWSGFATFSPFPAPVRDGYVIAGPWHGTFMNNGTSTTVTVLPGQRLSVPTSVDFTIDWNPSCNVVTLDANGGTSGSVVTVYKKTGDDRWFTDSSCTVTLSDLSTLVPTRSGYVFRGFYPDNLSDEYADITSDYDGGVPPLIGTTTIAPGWLISTNKTLYASWVQDCEVPEHGNCSISIGSMGQVDYITGCANGYTIADEDTATPTCTAYTYTCSAGQYLNGDGCATCMAGSYCTGGSYTYNGQIQGQSACPSGYGNSDAGSDSESDCYRACTASDVSNATTVSGRVYSDGTNACDATGCENGYSVQPGTDLNCTIGTVEGDDITYDSSTMTFSLDYGSAGSITGRGQCSTQSGISSGAPPSPTLPDSSGRYCYCTLDGYTPVGGSAQSLSGPWVFRLENDRVIDCSNDCAFLCAYGLQSTSYLEFRTALFGSVPSTAQCVPNTYTVSYAANGGSGSAPTVPTSCTYGSDCAAPANTYTRTGYTFAGWKCTGGTTACDGDIIAAGGSLKNVSTGSAITLTAQWTAKTYTCSAGQYLNGDGCATCMAGSYCTGGSYTYNGQIQGQSACPSGYGNSDAGSDSESDCYRACTASDVSNATTVSGRVYSDGRNACDATGCENGYVVGSFNLSSAIGNATIVDSSYDSKAHTFYIEYSNGGVVKGSTEISVIDVDTAYELPPGTSDDYCYCRYDTYTSSGAVIQLNAPWVGTGAPTYRSECPQYCADHINGVISDVMSYKLLLSVPERLICTANTYTVSYAGNGNTGGSAPTSPTSCTYGSDCAAPANTYTRTGYTFAGWKCTGGTTACDGDIIAAGGSLKNVSTGSAITLTAQWTEKTYTCSAGQYLNGDGCATCMAGSYCTGGSYTYNGQIQGQSACPSGYGNSDAGSDSESDCYRGCTASDVLNATTVSGRVYSDGRNACDATGCESGYSVQPGSGIDLNSTIGTVAGDSRNYNASTMTFSVDYGSAGSITGRAQCSSQSGTAAWSSSGATISSTLPDSTGQYCYCALDGYTPVGGSAQSLFGPWVFNHDYASAADYCAAHCASLCADGLQDFAADSFAFRATVFGSVPSTAQCVPNTYTVSYVANGGSGSAPTAPTSCTYGSDCAAPANTYTRTGYTFAGWKCTGGTTACDGDIIAAGGSLKNVSTGSAITLTAQWTAKIYTCSAGQYLNGDGCATCMAGSYCTGGSYTYNGQIQGQSACPSGYGNSDAGSDSESDCYRACTVSDVSNATTVSGRVYSDGTNACDATGCENGYSVQPGSGIDLNSTIGTVAGGGITYDSSTMTFSVSYSSAGSITGRAQCSSQSGTAAWNGDVTISATLPDSSGRYCYCTLDGYTPVGGSAQSLSGPWVFYDDFGDAVNCAADCARYCAKDLQFVDTLRTALFGSVPSTAQCVPNTYTVSFNANGGTGGQSASVTATYAAAMPAISTTAPTRTGYTFVGWYDDADYASGVQYYTAAGASARNWNKTENATLYAGWTINGYDCKAGEYLNVTACKVCESGYYCPSTAVSYSYNGQIQGRTACPSGYGNSATGSVAQTACYLTTEAGKYVATAQGALTDCPAGDYCTGGVKVNYGSIGGSTPCPDGYRNGAAGYSAESQCLMTVLAGKYVASKNATSATNCAAGTAKAAHTVAYGSMSSCDVCGANQYSDAGAGACSACATDKGYSNSGDVAENHAGVESCKTMCGPGTWVATAGGVCENVGAGYYGAGGIVLQGSISANRGQCVAPLTTIGYGFGANEADDCGRKLHAGSEVIYLRSAPRTSPALNVRVGDDIFYGAMSTALSGKLKVKDVDNTTYSVVNDYQ